MLVALSSVWGAGPEYLVSAWNEMGAEATLLTMDSTGWGQAITTGNYDVSIVQTASIGPNMRKPLKLFTRPNNRNGGRLLHTTDSYLDEEALAAERAATSAESCRHYANVQQRLWKEWHQMGLSAPTHQNFSKDIDLSLGGYPIVVRRVASR